MKILGYIKIVIIWIALGKLVFDVAIFIEPVFRPEGIITKGSYRGLKIGDKKIDVLLKLDSPYQRMCFKGYKFRGKVFLAPDIENDVPKLSAINIWYLSYPSIHREHITLNFYNEHLIFIKFGRSAIELP